MNQRFTVKCLLLTNPLLRLSVVFRILSEPIVNSFNIAFWNKD